MGVVYVVGTCDTKQDELAFVKSVIVEAGVKAVLVDVGTRGSGHADITAEDVAAHHPAGKNAVLGLNDRATAVEAMGLALSAFLSAQGNIDGVIGLGGSGNTGIVTRAMRALPVGVPKIMVSTIASGNVAAYVGSTDIAMMYSITDIAGLNQINRTVLGNAAHAIAGMAKWHLPTVDGLHPQIGLTQFGVTTPCVDQVRSELDDEFDCMSFHATGIGGQTMEKLVDSGFLSGVIDITTTEVADFLVGGVLPCTEDRFGSIIRTKIPYVMSLGALDMVNFWSRGSVPKEFGDRTFHMHNPEVTLMRTSVDECRRIGEWIAAKLNRCEGSVRVLIPEGGMSALDMPGKSFHSPEADAALFDALERDTMTTKDRRISRLPYNINDPAFSTALVKAFIEIARRQ
ncbi:Tm-1-like ATP-binding domain-containing protein [Xanthobacter sp. KR7-225]|uniref:Tm-1-like ATP-binding domain-containing protein n=1 Tax=Xanthobacter sp. KR7-225 TaxID=3156613 RepID=UPI0032B5471E